MKASSKALACVKAGLLIFAFVFSAAGALLENVMAAAFDYQEISMKPPADYLHKNGVCSPTLGDLWLPFRPLSDPPSPLLAYHEGKLSAIIYALSQKDFLRHKDWTGLQVFTLPENAGAPNVRNRIPVDHFDIIADPGPKPDGSREYQIRLYFLPHQEDGRILCGKRQQPVPR